MIAAPGIGKLDYVNYFDQFLSHSNRILRKYSVWQEILEAVAQKMWRPLGCSVILYSNIPKINQCLKTGKNIDRNKRDLYNETTCYPFRIE